MQNVPEAFLHSRHICILFHPRRSCRMSCDFDRKDSGPAKLFAISKLDSDPAARFFSFSLSPSSPPSLTNFSCFSGQWISANGKSERSNRPLRVRSLGQPFMRNKYVNVWPLFSYYSPFWPSTELPSHGAPATSN